MQKNIIEVDLPIVEHYISMIREMDVSSTDFRRYIGVLAQTLFAQASKDFEMIDDEIVTWKGEGSFKVLDVENIVFIPILRAGLPMLDGVLRTFPEAVSGFLAMKRDEQTLKSKIYYDRVPDIKGKMAVVLDPMVATGGSLIDAINLIKTKKPKNIISLNLVASPEGIENVAKSCEDVRIYIAKIDEKLNDEGFIIPGIGDAGDRAYNTL